MQVSRLPETFLNNSLAKIRLSLHKIRQSEDFLGIFFGCHYLKMVYYSEKCT